MGEMIKRVIIYVGNKASKMDATDYITQDTVRTFIEIAKEIVKP
ncbi:hypothetical protein [Aneurinibacillus tyrosinisolvens]|nr:hypothetical protein [Aneurinibacillus tyrosinisolvens]